MIVTVPGYDRHFLLLETLGFELVGVDMHPDGPDVDGVERLAADRRLHQGLPLRADLQQPERGDDQRGEGPPPRGAALRRPPTSPCSRTTPTGCTTWARRTRRSTWCELCADAGHPDRAFVFASTSKVTFAGAGLGFVASSTANVAWMSKYLGAQSIGPNKVEQARHVRFLENYPGGLDGLMRDHAALIAPKFAMVDEVLDRRAGHRRRLRHLDHPARRLLLQPGHRQPRGGPGGGSWPRPPGSA